MKSSHQREQHPIRGTGIRGVIDVTPLIESALKVDVRHAKPALICKHFAGELAPSTAGDSAAQAAPTAHATRTSTRFTPSSAPVSLPTCTGSPSHVARRRPKRRSLLQERARTRLYRWLRFRETAMSLEVGRARLCEVSIASHGLGRRLMVLASIVTRRLRSPGHAPSRSLSTWLAWRVTGRFRDAERCPVSRNRLLAGLSRLLDGTQLARRLKWRGRYV